MLAIDVGDAKTIGLALAVGFVLFAIVSAFVIKKITKKIICVILFGGLALGVWTQRQAVQDCSNKLQASASTSGVSGSTCKFFGTEVRIPPITVP